MCSALVSVHGLKDEVYIDALRAGFNSWIKERVICVARLFRFMD